MNMTLETMLEGVSSEMVLESMKNSLSNWNNTAKETDISHKDIKRLSEAILALPNEGQNLLLGNYVFNLTENGLNDLFDITDADIKLQFFERLLSKSLRLPEDMRISDKSMEKSCRRVLAIIVNREEPNQKSILIYIGKSIAAMFLIGIIAFGTAMSVNAEFREQVIKWFMEATKQYTLFRLENENELDSSELKKFIPSYIPERYHLYSRDVVTGFATYTYVDVNEDLLNVSICMPDSNAYLNTENMSKENIVINGASGYLYHDGTHGSLATNIDGYALYVTGKASKEEFIKIAEGVIKK